MKWLNELEGNEWCCWECVETSARMIDVRKYFVVKNVMLCKGEKTRPWRQKKEYILFLFTLFP